jgi:hypothetical protein
MSYIILRGRWCNIIVINVHASCEDTSDDIRDSFYEELFDQFPRYDMKILLGDFNAKLVRDDEVRGCELIISSHRFPKYTIPKCKR